MFCSKVNFYINTIKTFHDYFNLNSNITAMMIICYFYCLGMILAQFPFGAFKCFTITKFQDAKY